MKSRPGPGSLCLVPFPRTSLPGPQGEPKCFLLQHVLEQACSRHRSGRGQVQCPSGPRAEWVGITWALPAQLRVGPRGRLPGRSACVITSPGLGLWWGLSPGSTFPSSQAALPSWGQQLYLFRAASRVPFDLLPSVVKLG